MVIKVYKKMYIADPNRENFLVLVNRLNPIDRIVKKVDYQVVNTIVDAKSKPTYNEIQEESFNSLKNFVHNKTLDNNKRKLISFKPPHDAVKRARLANMVVSDPFTNRMINLFVEYVFGIKPKPRIVPVVTDTPETRAESDKLVDEVITKTQREKFLKFLTKIDELSGIYSYARKAHYQSFCYGTAVLWKGLSLKTLKSNKIDIPIGTPVRIKEINGFQLGNVYQDIYTFDPVIYEYNNPTKQLVELVADDGTTRITEVAYRDNIKPYTESIIDSPLPLPYDRLIVFDRENPGIIPDSQAYGISPLDAMISTSENIRRIIQKILPEINETQYAPVGLFRVKKDTNYNMDKLARDVSVAGNKIVVNDDVDYVPIPTGSNIKDILAEKDALVEDLNTAFGIPPVLFKNIEASARATMEILINIFQSTRLKNERKFVSEVLWKYWYKDLMLKFFPDKELLNLDIKIEIEFDNLVFTPFIDKGDILLQSYLNGTISLPEYRKSIDMSATPEGELKIPESAAQKSNFGNEMGGQNGGNGPGSGSGAGTGKPPANQKSAQLDKQTMRTKQKQAELTGRTANRPNKTKAK